VRDVSVQPTHMAIGWTAQGSPVFTSSAAAPSGATIQRFRSTATDGRPAEVSSQTRSQRSTPLTKEAWMAGQGP
ncbi:unnamed protein product, partial [Polarella glacialis]